MQESTNQPDPGPLGTEQTPVAPEPLEPQDPQQAVFSRGSRSLVRDIIYLVVLVVLIGSVIVLLASPGLRGRLLTRAGKSWQRVSGQGEQTGIFQLPAPPPKSVEPKIVYQGTPATGGVIAQRNRPPIVIRDSGSEEGTEEQTPAGDDQKPPAPPEKTDASKSAYEALLKKSPVAQKIATGGFEGYKFKEWKPVRNAAPEFWVDIVATGPTGRDSHFIWLINTESGTLEAKSQDARDAERSSGGAR